MTSSKVLYYHISAAARQLRVLFDGCSMRLRCIVAVLSALAATGVYADFDKSFYAPLMKMPINELLNIGDKHHDKGNIDSAMAYYTVAANRYDDNLPDSVKELCIGAMSGLADMTFYYLHDYNRAFSYLTKAIRLADGLDCDYLKMFIRINMADVQVVYGDTAMAYNLYREAFDIAHRNGYIDVCKNLLIDFVFFATCSDNFGSIRPVFDDYAEIELPENEKLTEYIALLNRGTLLYTKKRYAEALVAADKAVTAVDVKTPLNLYELLAKTFAAQICSKLGRHDEAIARLEACLTPGLPLHIRRDLLCKLTEFYAAAGKEDAANAYRMEYLTVNDSVLSYGKYMTMRDSVQSYLLDDMGRQVAESDGHSGLGYVLSALVAALLTAAAGTILWRRKSRQMAATAAAAAETAEDTAQTNAGDAHETAGKPAPEATEEKAEKTEAEAKTAEKKVETAVETDKPAPTGKRKKPAAAAAKPKPDKRTLELAREIRAYLDTSNDIYGQDFSLEKLAATFQVHTRSVSRAINDVFGQNFYNILSQYRVKEACRRLSSPEYANVTIQAISTDCGFKSRSNFVSVFRKLTGLTPNEYQKKALAGQQGTNTDPADKK